MYINPPVQDAHRATARFARGEASSEWSWAALVAGGAQPLVSGGHTQKYCLLKNSVYAKFCAVPSRRCSRK